MYKRTLLLAVMLLGIHASSLAQSPAQATHDEIQKTFGFVPAMFKLFPEEGIAGAWEEFKALSMNPQSALPPRTKELIGLAVAAQIPCRYCSYYHAQFAKADGGTDREVKEALAIAAVARHWATLLDGSQLDLRVYKQDVVKMFDYASRAKPAQPPIDVVDAPSAYKDMEQTFGFVPPIVKRIPAAAVAGAWRELQAIELASDTAIDKKTKHLIALGVAAQIPCAYTIYFHSEAARHEGATEDEINEAIAIAAMTRHWSTILNGSLIDENAFRRDVDRIVRRMRAQTAHR